MGFLPPCNLCPVSPPDLHLHLPATFLSPAGGKYCGGSAFHTWRWSYASHLIVFPGKVVDAYPVPLAIRLRRGQQIRRAVPRFCSFQVVRWTLYGERSGQG